MEVDLDTAKLRAFDKPLSVEGLQQNTLPDLLDAHPMVIFYFLRHMGCAHCKYLVSQLNQVRQSMPRFPRVVFVHMESLEEGREFFKEYYPNASHIADPQRELYRLFGIKSQKGLNLLNPTFLFKTVQRVASGYSNALVPKADPFMLSGMFLFREGEPVWMHRASYAGDDQKAVNMLRVLGKQKAPAGTSAQEPASQQKATAAKGEISHEAAHKEVPNPEPQQPEEEAITNQQ
jgi:peroxiredoxin